MGKEKTGKSSSERWAEFRFSIVGGLLSCPPQPGELTAMLKNLAETIWKHPITGASTEYSYSTIERWYYRSKKEQRSTVAALQRKHRSDTGVTRVLDDVLKNLLRVQYGQHQSWTYKLHADNLAVKIREDNLGVAVPSTATVRRWMQSCGLRKIPRVRGQITTGELAARVHRATTEIRSYENEYVGGLWHLDYHHCRRQILLPNGRWHTPVCLAVLDDCSRIAAHVQWYLAENAENLVHAFCQALQKRGLPRLLLTDNGSPMLSAEVTSGLLRLGIVHETTLPYSPYQNGKQERFWGSLEGRCVAMLENLPDLDLSTLNNATCAWVEMEYNRTPHSEIGGSPLEQFLNAPSVSRPCPSSAELKLAFMRDTTRIQRRNDGTVSVNARRFEVPARYRSLRELRLRYAEWDLSLVHMVDATGNVLCPLYPQNKQKNSSGMRKSLTTEVTATEAVNGEIAPLLNKLMADYAATGLPPNYLPKDENIEDKKK